MRKRALCFLKQGLMGDLSSVLRVSQLGGACFGLLFTLVFLKAC